MSSKIKVDTIENVAGSGNVSLGSGHNLVVPGNITGSGTATITGDFTVDTNVLKVDSSNNRVGIGTASPLSDLHQDIGLTEREGHHLYYGTDAKAAFTVLPNTGEIRIGAATTGTSGNYNTEIMSRNGSNLITSIKADAYGRVTKPSQPAFAATSSSDITVTTDGIIAFDQTSINVGNHFNTSTNRFTAPVAGTYLFLSTISMRNVSSTGTYLAIYYKKNNSGTGFRMRFRAANVGNEWDGTSGHAILNLAANDYVELFGYNESGQFIMQGSETNFTGYLLQ